MLYYNSNDIFPREKEMFGVKKYRNYNAIDELGRVVIPAPLRRICDVRPGDKLVFTANDGKITIEKAKDVCYACGSDVELTQIGNRHFCKACVKEMVDTINNTAL
jgi:AbrB family looped-hinge helix DNA binding protein